MRGAALHDRDGLEDHRDFVEPGLELLAAAVEVVKLKRQRGGFGFVVGFDVGHCAPTFCHVVESLVLIYKIPSLSTASDPLPIE